MRFLLSVLPVAACAAVMFLCFRMMRHSDMPADGHAESDDLDTLRKEVADLREELARARSVPSDPAAADGTRWIFRRGTSRPLAHDGEESVLEAGARTRDESHRTA